MGFSFLRYRFLFFSIIFIAMLSGCSALMFGGIAGSVAYFSQEREIRQIVDDYSIWFSIKAKLDKKINKNYELNHHVSVDVVEGKVMLSGVVANYSESISACKIAWQQNGVKEVVNEIQVTDTKYKNFAADASITSQVKSKMLLAKGIRSNNYNVETVNNVVYLFGIAYDKYELSEAIDIAKRTYSVKKVVSHVVLRREND